MMPVQEEAGGPQPQQSPVQSAPVQPTAEAPNYRKKYKTLKRKMRMLVYEQECFVEELKKSQRKLLKVSRDRSFLLDRLLQFEKLEDTSDDSDATATSDSEADGKDGPPSKKKKTNTGSNVSLTETAASLLAGSLGKQQASWLLQMTGTGGEKGGKGDGKKKAQRVAKKIQKGPGVVKVGGLGGATLTKSQALALASMTAGNPNAKSPGQMTREELERHLELKQSAKPQFMSLEKTPYSLPEDIFSHDNSNQEIDPSKTQTQGISTD